MPRTSERGGPQTRARIAEIAAPMFLERGFDAVTVAEVARAAGVSSVTVYNHFPRKEDLYLDRSVDAVEFLRRTVRDRPADQDVVSSLRAACLRLADERGAFSALDDRSVPFLQTVAGSPALLARAREITADLERTLADELVRDHAFEGDAILLATFFVAGYSTVFVGTARRLMAGEVSAELIDDHRERLERLFEALRGGVA